ncbi:MAG: DUF4091 domain-containing protein [Ruminococcaceae bacterium]|nr:DUF4091 domain-containing protein [Oscillospiraceae bacterium]
MKKLLTLVLTGAMLLSCAVSVFADDAGLALAEGSHLKIENGIVDMIDGAITVGELKANFAGAVDVAGKADDAAVCADDVVTAGGETAKAIIWGDASKDGKITLTDATRMLQSIAKWNVAISETAADVDRSGKLNLSDVSKLMQKLAKWSDISLGNVRMVFENKALTAEHDDPTLKLSFTSMMHKVGVKELSHTGENAYKMKLARNEDESCQALLWSDTAKEGMTAELAPFVHEYGDATIDGKLEWVIYDDKVAVFTTVIRDGKLTDPQEVYTDDMPEVLLDMADSFELKGERTQHFVITVSSTKDTPVGMYKSTLTFKDAEGKAVKCANVYAYVWDFTLPDAPYSASLFGTVRNPVVSQYPDYVEHMLTMNLSSYVPPVDLLTDEGTDYMNDPRVTAFIIDGFSYVYTGDIPDDQTVALYHKVKSNPEWFKKGVFYYTDEPYADGLFQVKTTYEYLANLLGIKDLSEVRNLTPFGQSYPDAEHQAKCIDAVEFIKPYINVWVPVSMAYHKWEEGGRWTPRFVYNKYGDYTDRVEEMRARGDDIWWYVCVAPEVPYANYFNCYQGVINRLLSWQQYFNNVNGVLYYATGEYWGGISKYQFDIKNGDGTLQFPGENWGRTGPQASWRLYQIRDGFDDFDYMKIAEELVGREAVMKIVTKVSSGMLKYTEDYRVLEAARDEIVQMILDNQK